LNSLKNSRPDRPLGSGLSCAAFVPLGTVLGLALPRPLTFCRVATFRLSERLCCKDRMPDGSVALTIRQRGRCSRSNPVVRKNSVRSRVPENPTLTSRVISGIKPRPGLVQRFCNGDWAISRSPGKFALLGFQQHATRGYSRKPCQPLSGSSSRKGVEVQVLSSAPIKSVIYKHSGALLRRAFSPLCAYSVRIFSCGRVVDGWTCFPEVDPVCFYVTTRRASSSSPRGAWRASRRRP